MTTMSEKPTPRPERGGFLGHGDNPPDPETVAALTAAPELGDTLAETPVPDPVDAPKEKK